MTRSLAELEDYLFCLSSSHQFVEHPFCFLVDIIRELRAHSTLTEIVIRSNLKAFATNGFLLTEQLSHVLTTPWMGVRSPSLSKES